MSGISTKDKIDRKEIVNKITTLVQDLPSGEHICVGLNGEWGSGKTFVMQMLHELFSAQPEYLVIDYDAWKNNFYQDPLIGILSCIVDGIQSYIKLNNVEEQLKKCIIETGKSIGNNILSAMKQAGGKIALFAYAIEGVKNIRKANTKFEDNKQLDDYKSYSTLLNEVKQQLNFITQSTTDIGKQIKLVILVDEIDRCLPNEQLIVLERLHHLFDVNNCAVVLAMNKMQIIKTFNNTYSANGNEYLRKFFDYEFFLPMSNSVFFINKFMSEILENEKIEFVKPISKQQVEFIQQYVFDCISFDFGNGASIDNRSLTKLIKNILSILLKMFPRELDFAYLFIISYLVSASLYHKTLFEELKDRKKTEPYDLFQDDKSNVNLLKISSYYMINNKDRINVYVDKEINTINFYFNCWLKQFDSKTKYNFKKYCSVDLKCDNDFEEKFSTIFNKVSILGA